MPGRPLEDIQDEILDELHGGEPIDRDAILAKYPEHADALRRFFQLIAVIETPAEPKPAQPSRLGEFEILREIGRGGMGVVYEARQVSLNRRVALKVLPPSMRQDRRLLQRFQREAEAAARLRHPNIVPVYSIGESAGAPFFAMELVEGRSLAEVIKQRKAGDDAGFPKAGPEYRRWAVTTIARIADALDYAHGRGILHRDVKPGNILLEADGTPRLTDFGLALDLQASELTQTGEMFGSPLYMSPEQAFRSGQPVDARTDIYSLAVTLYELLMLRMPYQGTTHAELMSALSSGTIVAPRRVDPGCPEPLERVLLQALRSDPHDRYATAGAFAVDLRASLERPEEVRASAAAERPAPVPAEADDIDEGWWRWIGGSMIIAGLAMFLGNGLTREALTFIGIGAALWIYEAWTQRHAPSRPASATPAAGAGTAPPSAAAPEPARGSRWKWALSGFLVGVFIAVILRTGAVPIFLFGILGAIVFAWLYSQRVRVHVRGQGEPHDRPLSGLIFEHSIERWMRALGIALIVAGLLLLLPEEPAVRATMVFVAAGAGLWLYDAITHRNQLRERAVARGEVPPPKVGEGFHSWRKERPVLSGLAIGCGCLVTLALAIGPCATVWMWPGRRWERPVGTVTSTATAEHGPYRVSVVPGVPFEQFRSLVLPYDLSFDSVQPDQPLRAARVERRADYPAPEWPPLLGGLAGLQLGALDDSDFDIQSGAQPDSSNEDAVRFIGPLEQRYVAHTGQVLACPEGIAKGGGITAQGYTVVLVSGEMAGRIVFESYGTLVVDGALSGSVEAANYANALVAGDLTGRWVGRQHGTLYIEGRLLGELQLDAASKVFIAGRTERADLERIRASAPVEVLLRDSDLPAGTHELGQITVTVAP